MAGALWVCSAMWQTSPMHSQRAMPHGPWYVGKPRSVRAVAAFRVRGADAGRCRVGCEATSAASSPHAPYRIIHKNDGGAPVLFPAATHE